MKNKNILTVVLTALAIMSASQIASAREDDNHPAYQEHNQHRGDDDRRWDHDGKDRLDFEIKHLNRMLNHVELKMRRFGANRHLWKEFQDIRADARRLNNQYDKGEHYFDRRRLRAQIEHIRNDLHHIERELHLRASDWYQWR